VGQVGRRGNVWKLGVCESCEHESGLRKEWEKEVGYHGWERTYELSDDDACSTNVRRILCPLSPASSIPSPKATTSSATLFFLSFLARRMRARSASGEASSRGEPTKTMTRCREFLFCRCLSASWAIAIAVGMDAVRPRLVEVLCTAVMIWPSSLVCVTSTSGLIIRYGALKIR